MARSQWVLVGFVFALAASTAGTALAQQTDVIVLEVRSVEGDDDFAHNLSRAIRQAAGDVEGWNVTSREVSLTQMALAFGCEGDEPDAACMSQIASDLQMGGIIYGTIQRTSAGSSYQYELRLRYYNARTTQIEQPISDTLSRAARADDMLEKARRWVARFAGREEGGGLRLVVNVPGAAVSIDGVPAGEADENGVFTSQNVAVGQRQVEVSAQGYRGFRATVTVTSGEVFELEVDLEEGSGTVVGGGGEDGPSLWPALTLYGLAAVTGAVWIVSFARIQNLNDDADWMAWRNEIGVGLNSCTQTENVMMGNAEYERLRATAIDTCSDGRRLKIMEFLFAGLTIASLVGGTLLLFRALNADDEEEEQPGALSFDAAVGPGSGFVNARLSF